MDLSNFRPLLSDNFFSAKIENKKHLSPTFNLCAQFEANLTAHLRLLLVISNQRKLNTGFKPPDLHKLGKYSALNVAIASRTAFI